MLLLSIAVVVEFLITLYVFYSCHFSSKRDIEELETQHKAELDRIDAVHQELVHDVQHIYEIIDYLKKTRVDIPQSEWYSALNKNINSFSYALDRFNDRLNDFEAELDRKEG